MDTAEKFFEEFTLYQLFDPNFGDLPMIAVNEPNVEKLQKVVDEYKDKFPNEYDTDDLHNFLREKGYQSFEVSPEHMIRF